MPRVRIRSDETRFLLSDILPYETPACFSNRGFAAFIKLARRSGVSFSLNDKKMVIKLPKQVNVVLHDILCILFGLKKSGATTKLEEMSVATEPYQFEVFARGGKMRVLSIVHPAAQLKAMLFTEKYKDLVIYYCGRSVYSIRRPVAVAKMKFVNDKTHLLPGLVDRDRASRIEMESLELECLKSYYRYKDFQNIHRFYESGRHHKLEKKYKRLARLDIANCFDSIYTHSIPWAVYGKDFVKAHLKFGSSFSDDLDKLMQSMNYNETHGIVIGPEFSRVAAEIILQRIDLDVERGLGEAGLVFKRDYEILRYVDDYFVFFNKDEHFEQIHSALSSALHEYKLSLNEAKKIIEPLPKATPLSIAKKEISKLVDETFSIDEAKEMCWSFFVDDLVTRFKVIVQMASVDYADVVPFMLSLVENKLVALIRHFDKALENNNIKEGDSEAIARTFEKTLAFVFYTLLSDEVPVNTYVIASRIIALMALTIKRTREKSLDVRIPQHRFYQMAIREMSRLIEQLESDGGHIKALHVINLAECVEDGLYLDQGLLFKVLEKGGDDYLTLTVLLHYSKTLKRFERLRFSIVSKTLDCLKSHVEGNCLRTDRSLLAFDLAACPFLSDEERRTVLAAFIEHREVKLGCSVDQLVSFLGENHLSFTNWSGTGILEALEYKRGLFVY